MVVTVCPSTIVSHSVAVRQHVGVPALWVGYFSQRKK